MTTDDLQIVIEDKEVAYWKKAKEESNSTIERLESALKFERATLKMIERELADAEANSSR